ncbi:hypothetical protein pb186bvf_003622 [Paramecium bursaria]
MIIQAHEAYLKKDVHMSHQAHQGLSHVAESEPLVHAEKHQTGGEYIKSAVYGGLDGMITTFSVVTGVVGANLAAGIVVTLGVSSLIGDGIAMALGDFIATKSENDFNKNERSREEWEVQNNPEGEKKEMVEIYKAKGIDHEDAVIITETLAKNAKVWVDVMMVEELGIMGINDHPEKDAIVTFFAFTLFGLMPILPYIVGYAADLKENLFPVSIAMTGGFLFILGVSKAQFSYQSWIYSGMETLIIGSCAAAASYLIGMAFGEQ